MEPEVHELDDVVVVAGCEKIQENGDYAWFSSREDEVSLYSVLLSPAFEYDSYS